MFFACSITHQMHFTIDLLASTAITLMVYQLPTDHPGCTSGPWRSTFHKTTFIHLIIVRVLSILALARPPLSVMTTSVIQAWEVVGKIIGTGQLSDCGMENVTPEANVVIVVACHFFTRSWQIPQMMISRLGFATVGMARTLVLQLWSSLCARSSNYLDQSSLQSSCDWKCSVLM